MVNLSAPTPPLTPLHRRTILHAPSSPCAKASSITSSRIKNQPPPRQVSRIPKTTSLNDALRFWEKGDEALGLLVPLKQWGTLYQPSEYRSEAQKLSMIRMVRDEFVKHCQADRRVFEQRYPGLDDQYTKLVKAIRAARIARGDAVGRKAH